MNSSRDSLMYSRVFVSHSAQSNEIGEHSDSLCSALHDWGFSVARSGDYKSQSAIDTVAEAILGAAALIVYENNITIDQGVEIGIALSRGMPILHALSEGSLPRKWHHELHSHGPYFMPATTPASFMVAVRNSGMVEKLQDILLVTPEARRYSIMIIKLLGRALDKSGEEIARYAINFEQLKSMYDSHRRLSRLVAKSPDSIRKGYLLQQKIAFGALSSHGSPIHRLPLCDRTLECVVDTADRRYWSELREYVTGLKTLGVPATTILRTFCMPMPDADLYRFDLKPHRSWARPDSVSTEVKGQMSAWRVDLHQWLCDVFSVGELLSWISKHYSDLRRKIPDQGMSIDAASDVFLSLAERRGVIDDDKFFASLRESVHSKSYHLASLEAICERKVFSRRA